MTDTDTDRRWSLTLYVAGASPRSAEAIDTVRRICDEELAAEQAELDEFIEQDVAAGEGRDADRAVMAVHRWADPGATRDPEPDQP